MNARIDEVTVNGDFLWGPTASPHDIDTQFGGYFVLEGPPYTEECWAGNNACAYPTAEVAIVIRTELLDTAADAVAFLKRWDFNAGN